MPSAASPTTRMVLLCLLVAALCAPARAQGPGLGPESYGLVPVFGMSAPVTARALAMGGPIASLPDVQFANAAFAPLQRAQNAGLRFVTTSHEHGPRVSSFLAYYGHPIEPGESGWQVMVLRLRGDGETMLPGVGAVGVGMSENALVVDYGRRFGPQLTAGLSILGYQRIGIDFTPPVGPALLDVSSRASFGARVGVTYEWQPGDFLAMTYSWSQLNVEAGGITLVPSVEQTFHGDLLAIGATGHITPELLAVVEFQRGSSTGGAFKDVRKTWHLGAEYQASPEWTVRAGLNDGEPTFGVGFSRDCWEVGYAYLRDWNSGSVGALFGSSTTHALQGVYRW